MGHFNKYFYIAAHFAKRAQIFCFRIKNSSVSICGLVPELAKAHAYPLATSSLLGLVAILPFGKSRAYATSFSSRARGGTRRVALPKGHYRVSSARRNERAANFPKAGGQKNTCIHYFPSSSY